MLNEPLVNSFPVGAVPNDAQEYIIDEIEKAIALGKKFIIINAPTATGKSYIAKTIANFSDDPTDGFVTACNSYQIYDSEDPQVSDEDLAPFGTAILTVTKSLQDQYTDFFEDGISGGENSSEIRKTFAKHLGLPERISSSALLKIINSYMTYDEYKEIINNMWII